MHLTIIFSLKFYFYCFNLFFICRKHQILVKYIEHIKCVEHFETAVPQRRIPFIYFRVFSNVFYALNTLQRAYGTNPYRYYWNPQYTCKTNIVHRRNSIMPS